MSTLISPEKSEFRDRVLELVLMIPKGKVTTYKELARALGKPNAYRAVGNALARNPSPMKIPCHRVVRSNCKIGEYKLGQRRKVELLSGEGVVVKKGKVDLQKFFIRLYSKSR